jgi:hypothetical protein
MRVTARRCVNPECAAGFDLGVLYHCGSLHLCAVLYPMRDAYVVRSLLRFARPRLPRTQL